MVYWLMILVAALLFNCINLENFIPKTTTRDLGFLLTYMRVETMHMYGNLQLQV